MRKHLTYHLERLALLALPPEDGEDAEDAASNRSSQSQRGAHRGRRDSLQDDFRESDPGLHDWEACTIDLTEMDRTTVPTEGSRLQDWISSLGENLHDPYGEPSDAQGKLLEENLDLAPSSHDLGTTNTPVAPIPNVQQDYYSDDTDETWDDDGESDLFPDDTAASRTPAFRISERWTIAELGELPELLGIYGTDWKSISERMMTKTAEMVC